MGRKTPLHINIVPPKYNQTLTAYLQVYVAHLGSINNSYKCFNIYTFTKYIIDETQLACLFSQYNFGNLFNRKSLTTWTFTIGHEYDSETN